MFYPLLSFTFFPFSLSTCTENKNWPFDALSSRIPYSVLSLSLFCNVLSLPAAAAAFPASFLLELGIIALFTGCKKWQWRLTEQNCNVSQMQLSKWFSVPPPLCTFWQPWKASGCSSEGLWLEIWKNWVTSPGCHWCAPVLCTSVNPFPLQPLSLQIQSTLHHCLSLLT